MKRKNIYILRDVATVIIILVLATLIGALFKELALHEANMVVVYIFSVLIISRFTKGYFYGVAASVISLLLFNWFFTEPYFTLKVNDATYIITFSIMMLTSILTSALTTKAKKSAEEAREREKQSNALYQMTNHLTDAEDSDAIARVIVKSVSETILCPAAFICFDDDGYPEKSFVQLKDNGDIVRRELECREELKRRMDALHGPFDATESHYDYPIYGSSSVLAVLRIPGEVGEKLSPMQERMLHSIMESAALALERQRSIMEEAKSREETTQERYRANLLRAISHDIRTPLSAIMGSSEMLMNSTDELDERHKLAKDINQDALWLHGLVENILNLTRIQDGKLSLEKQPEALEEVIGASLTVMEKRLPERRIGIDMPEQLLIVPMDAKLISQVIVNLLDNAAKHTREEDEISVSVSCDGEFASITVADRGCGISERDLPYIFQMFYTKSGKSPDSKRGVGLGLAICESIVEAHGGKIHAKNRDGGGAAFTFTLPMEGKTDD